MSIRLWHCGPTSPTNRMEMISSSHTCDRIQAKELENLKAQWKFINFAEKRCWRYMEHSREASHAIQ
jgi:hypothetical protein